MKKLLLSMLVATSLFAFTATIKKDNVTLEINETIKTYKVTDIISLNGGEIICFIKGNGRVILKGDNYKKQLSKRTKLCKKLPVPSNVSKDYLAMIQKNVVTIFANSQEKEIDGISRKSVTINSILNKDIILDLDKKFISIENNTWGPLPVQLNIYDKDNKLILESINSEDIKTSFIIPLNIIAKEDGYRIEISNAFGDKLMNAKILLKKDN